MAPGNDRNWCKKRWHGDVWHDCCARLMACRMSGWVRKMIKFQSTVAEVNAQSILWQRPCDELLDMILCDCCINEKIKPFKQGKAWNRSLTIALNVKESNIFFNKRSQIADGWSMKTMQMSYRNACGNGPLLTRNEVMKQDHSFRSKLK